MTARRGRTQLGKWLAAAWWRRVEFEMADEAGVLDESVEPAAALWPETARFEHPVEAVLDVFWQGRAETTRRGPRPRREDPTGGRRPARRCTRIARPAQLVRSRVARPSYRQGRAACPQQGQRCPRRHAAGARPAVAADRAAGCSRSSTCAWCASSARCWSPSPTTSARAAMPTWPTSSAAPWRCCATTSSPAGCRSASTRASATS